MQIDKLIKFKIMKKITFTATLLTLGTITTSAQMPVTDVTANTQLQLILQQQLAINQQLAKLNAESSNNQVSNSKSFIENQKQRLLGENGLKLSEDIEKTYWKVSDYVRRGAEMNNILFLEKDIIKKLRNLRELTNSLNYKERSSILSSTNNILSSVGNFVDSAIGIVTDGQYRMTNEERRQYLKEIENSLSSISNSLDNKLISTKSYSYYKMDSEQRKKNFNSAIKHQKNAQKQLSKQKK